MPAEPPLDVIRGAIRLCPKCAARERRRWGRSLRGYVGPISLLPNGDIVVATPDAPRRMAAAFEILMRVYRRTHGLPEVPPPPPPPPPTRPPTFTDEELRRRPRFRPGRRRTEGTDGR